MLLGGVAHAQTSAEPSLFYAEAVAQSAFGNVTSQSYGGEVGVRVWKTLQVFVEFGHVRDVGPDDFRASAQLVAGFLSQLPGVGGVTPSVKEPATFGAVGVRYPIPVTFYRAEPYVLAGVGAAKVTKNVSFSASGKDLTSSLPNLSVILGSDLSGDFTKPMLVLGGGVVWPVWRSVIVDVQLRFNRIAAEGQDPLAPEHLNKGTSFGRVGVGVGYRF